MTTETMQKAPGGSTGGSLPSRKVTDVSSAPTIIPDYIRQAAADWWAQLSPLQQEAINGRFERGLELALQGDASHFSEETWTVRSSNNGSYTVEFFSDLRTCTCPDYDNAPFHVCKHIIAVNLTRKSQEIAKLLQVNPEAYDHLQQKGGNSSMPKLGYLYCKYLKGSDLSGPTNVEILALKQVAVMPVPGKPTIVKWCMFLKPGIGIDVDMPVSVLIGAQAEKDLLKIFGRVDVEQLKGKQVQLIASEYNIAGTKKIGIRFQKADAAQPAAKPAAYQSPEEPPF